jgi:hypothetical protein
VRPLDSTTNKFKNYFGLYSGCTFIGEKTYINCGGVLGDSIHSK